MPINDRYNQLFERYLNSASQSNPLIKQLINEYENSFNSIIKNEHNSIPLTYISRYIHRNIIHNIIESIENNKVTNSIQTTTATTTCFIIFFFAHATNFVALVGNVSFYLRLPRKNDKFSR